MAEHPETVEECIHFYSHERIKLKLTDPDPAEYRLWPCRQADYDGSLTEDVQKRARRFPARHRASVVSMFNAGAMSSSVLMAAFYYLK